MDVDVVVMWVDGNDPEWIKEKNKYSPVKIDDSNSTNRFRDWGLMKYWFRSIEKYMPWVRKIFFVTWGHTPDFLNLEHPKLRVVCHKDFMPKAALPTFSSCAIELNLHKIEDLSEYFILFNDDTFINKNLPPEYFFKNNLPCSHYAEVPFPGDTEAWAHNANNDIAVINRHFCKSQSLKHNRCKYINRQYRWFDNIRTVALALLFPNYYTGFLNFHSPAAYLKSTFKTVWSKEPELLRSTTYHRFRAYEDLNQWVMLWWQLASGKFSPQKMNCCTFSANEKNINEVCRAIVRQSYDMICINDPSDDIDFDYVCKELRKAYEKMLPEKCSFEK